MDLMKLKNNLTSSFLLKGTNSDMLEDALAFARAFLRTTNLDVCQDFVYVSANGKKTIGVEDILPLLQKVAYPPVVAEKIVVVLNDMEKLTVAAQNKLLVMLEENQYCFVVGIVREDTLLDTIKSRMRLVEYPLLSLEDFLKKHSLSKDDDYMFYACDGNDVVYEHIADSKPMFLALKNACMGSKKHEIFKILHLVKEKDKSAVTEDKILVKAIIRAMTHIYVSLAYTYFKEGNGCGVDNCIDICERLSEDVNKVMQSSYTKNDFLNLLIFCVEKED